VTKFFNRLQTQTTPESANKTNTSTNIDTASASAAAAAASTRPSENSRLASTVSPTTTFQASAVTPNENNTAMIMTSATTANNSNISSTANNAVNMINNRISIKNSSVERLSRIVAAAGLIATSSDAYGNISPRPLVCPMVSLPENDNYWCEGWKIGGGSHSDELNNDELVISSSSLSTPLSTSSSSSPSPSPSNQSSSNFTKQHQQQHQLLSNTFTSVDFESLNEQAFRESFADKVKREENKTLLKNESENPGNQNNKLGNPGKNSFWVYGLDAPKKYVHRTLKDQFTHQKFNKTVFCILTHQNNCILKGQIFS
jgi:hypothetical protein